MKHITEYWIRPLDEHGDSIDIIFCGTLREARNEAKSFENYEIEKCVRRYADDGKLISEQLSEVD